jgi:hypothetical protein
VKNHLPHALAAVGLIGVGSLVACEATDASTSIKPASGATYSYSTALASIDDAGHASWSGSPASN